jgi:hypothetical protein
MVLEPYDQADTEHEDHSDGDEFQGNGSTAGPGQLRAQPAGLAPGENGRGNQHHPCCVVYPRNRQVGPDGGFQMVKGNCNRRRCTDSGRNQHGREHENRNFSRACQPVWETAGIVEDQKGTGPLG